MMNQHDACHHELHCCCGGGGWYPPRRTKLCCCGGGYPERKDLTEILPSIMVAFSMFWMSFMLTKKDRENHPFQQANLSSAEALALKSQMRRQT